MHPFLRRTCERKLVGVTATAAGAVHPLHVVTFGVLRREPQDVQGLERTIHTHNRDEDKKVNMLILPPWCRSTPPLLAMPCLLTGERFDLFAFELVLVGRKDIYGDSQHWADKAILCFLPITALVKRRGTTC